MEAVGQLTGGISHDFNNILMVILGNLELLKLRLPEGDDDAVELIDETLRATRHGQDLTGDLLAFSRRRQLNPQPVGINALVENIIRLLGRTLGATVRITTATSRDAGVALVDPAALEAAILNIALNARDAMPDGGTLTRGVPRSTTAPALPAMPTAVARTILVADDEPAVRATVRRQLETLGHKVVVADAAAKALDLLRAAEPPDVLLTDVVLGTGMNGIDLADAARLARPDLPVILMSGFTAVPEAQARIRALGAPLLSKPSTLSQLERALHEVCPEEPA